MGDTVKPSDEALAQAAIKRKQRSETILAKEGVPVNRSLPALPGPGDSLERTAADVAYRAMCLIAVAMKGERQDTPMVLRVIRQYGLARHLSERERLFIKDATPSKSDNVRFSWRYEAAWTLLWALGYVVALGRPDRSCDVGRVVACMRERSSAQFLRDAKLRGTAEILDQADLIYRYNRAVIDALVARKTPPVGLNPGVTHERHHALTWLIGRQDRSWDAGV